MSENQWPKATNEAAAWREHNLSQLRHFVSLTLRQKMEAVEGMADVVRRFTEMRERGQFTPADRRRR